ncbi:unnamed protein product, partial [Choristocarpus tenellus]
MAALGGESIAEIDLENAFLREVDLLEAAAAHGKSMSRLNVQPGQPVTAAIKARSQFSITGNNCLLMTTRGAGDLQKCEVNINSEASTRKAYRWRVMGIGVKDWYTADKEDIGEGILTVSCQGEPSNLQLLELVVTVSNSGHMMEIPWEALFCWKVALAGPKAHNSRPSLIPAAINQRASVAWADAPEHTSVSRPFESRTTLLLHLSIGCTMSLQGLHSLDGFECQATAQTKDKRLSHSPPPATTEENTSGIHPEGSNQQTDSLDCQFLCQGIRGDALLAQLVSAFSPEERGLSPTTATTHLKENDLKENEQSDRPGLSSHPVWESAFQQGQTEGTEVLPEVCVVKHDQSSPLIACDKVETEHDSAASHEFRPCLGKIKARGKGGRHRKGNAALAGLQTPRDDSDGDIPDEEWRRPMTNRSNQTGKRRRLHRGRACPPPGPGAVGTGNCSRKRSTLQGNEKVLGDEQAFKHGNYDSPDKTVLREEVGRPRRMTKVAMSKAEKSWLALRKTLHERYRQFKDALKASELDSALKDALKGSRGGVLRPGFRIFHRQEHAFTHIDALASSLGVSEGNDLKVFSYETNSTGSRKFMVCDLELFQQNYLKHLSGSLFQDKTLINPSPEPLEETIQSSTASPGPPSSSPPTPLSPLPSNTSITSQTFSQLRNQSPYKIPSSQGQGNQPGMFPGPEREQDKAGGIGVGTLGGPVVTCLQHVYEIIRDGVPCRMYFDLEFARAHNPGLDGEALVRTWINIVAGKLYQDYSIEVEDSDFLDLDSSTPKKFSRHLILHLPRGQYSLNNNSHVGRFVNDLASDLEATCPGPMSSPATEGHSLSGSLPAPTNVYIDSGNDPSLETHPVSSLSPMERPNRQHLTETLTPAMSVLDEGERGQKKAACSQGSMAAGSKGRG